MILIQRIRTLFSLGGWLFFSRDMILNRLLFTCLLPGTWFLAVPGYGQDLHYTQFRQTPFIISPGLTGVFQEDTRVMASYRRQWFSVPQVNFETFSVAADLKLQTERATSNGYFALGFSVNRDQAGTAKLTLLKLDINGSYTRRLSSHAFLSFGMQGAFNQRRFDIRDLSFNQQYNLDIAAFDPSLPTGERRFDSIIAYFSLAAGFNFRLQALDDRVLVDDKRSRSKVDIGFGLFNVNRPNQSFEEDEPVQLPIRLSSYILSTIQLGRNSNYDLVVNALTQAQQQYFEMVGMFGIKYHLSRQIDASKALQLSFAVRSGDQPGNYLDAVAPGFVFFVDDWQFGLSYDINVSPFRASTDGNSGIEFALRRGINKVRLPYPRPYLNL